MGIASIKARINPKLASIFRLNINILHSINTPQSDASLDFEQGALPYNVARLCPSRKGEPLRRVIARASNAPSITVDSGQSVLAGMNVHRADVHFGCYISLLSYQQP